MKKLLLTLFVFFGVLAGQSAFAEKHTLEDTKRILTNKIFHPGGPEWELRWSFSEALDKVIVPIIDIDEFNDGQKVNLVNDVVALNELVRGFHVEATLAAGHDEDGNVVQAGFEFRDTKKLYNKITLDIITVAFISKHYSKLGLFEGIDDYIVFTQYTPLMNSEQHREALSAAAAGGRNSIAKYSRLFYESLMTEKKKIAAAEQSKAFETFKITVIQEEKYRNAIDEIILNFGNGDREYIRRLNGLIFDLKDEAKQHEQEDLTESRELFNPEELSGIFASLSSPHAKDRGFTNITDYIYKLIKARFIGLALDNQLAQHPDYHVREAGGAAGAENVREVLQSLLLRYAPSSDALASLQDQGRVQRAEREAQSKVQTLVGAFNSYFSRLAEEREAHEQEARDKKRREEAYAAGFCRHLGKTSMSTT